MQFQGMTDAELEAAVTRNNKGFAPWVYWASELYSYGKCLRHWVGYPGWLPLFVYADHGVSLQSSLAPHEVESPARVHFTWNAEKLERYRDDKKKNITYIPHPWITYRRSQKIERVANPKGTIVFFTHLAPGFEWENRDSEDYFNSLRALPEKFQPVVLCLHMHDIKEGVHKHLRKQGFPIVTAGNTFNVDFVDRFYALARNFAYASSASWGSNVAYCIELGIPYFYFGEVPVLHNVSSTQLPVGVVDFSDEHHRRNETKAMEMFRHPVDQVTQEQKEFIEYYLGLDATTSRLRSAVLIWRELLVSWRSWRIIFSPFVSALRNNSPTDLTKKFFRRFRSSP